MNGYANYLTCQDCGKKKEDVKETVCPFDEEKLVKETKVVLCDTCYHERFMEI